MQEQLRNDNHFSNFPRSFQNLVMAFFNYQGRGFQLENEYSFSKLNQLLAESDKKTYCELTAPIEQILQTSHDDFVAAVKAVDIQEHKKQLSLIVEESMLAQYYNPLNFEPLRKLQELQKIITQYVILANCLLKSKNEEYQDITNLSMLLIKLESSTDEIELMVSQKIQKYSEESKIILKDISTYCEQDDNIRSFLLQVSNEKVITIEGALVFAVIKNLPLIFKSDSRIDEKITSDQEVIAFDFTRKRVSLLLNTDGYNFKNIWHAISEKKIFSSLLKALMPYSEKNCSSLVPIKPIFIDQTPVTDGDFAILPVDIVMNIIKNLQPYRGTWGYPFAYRNLIHFALASKSIYRFITTVLKWTELKLVMMRDRYGCELDESYNVSNSNTNELDESHNVSNSNTNELTNGSINKKTKLEKINTSSYVAQFVQTNLNLSDNYYRKFIRSIKRKKLSDFTDGSDDTKEDSYLDFIAALKYFKDLNNLEKKLDEEVIQKCILHVHQAIQKGNITAWFLLNILMLHPRPNLRNKAVVDTKNKLEKEARDVTEICIKHLCCSPSDHEIVKYNFSQLKKDQDIFIKYNFIKMKRVFISFYKKYDKISGLSSKLLLALYYCESPEKVLDALRLDEVKFLSSTDLGKIILRLISNDVNIYTHDQAAIIVDFFLAMLRSNKNNQFLVAFTVTEFKRYESINYSLLFQLILFPVGRIILRKLNEVQLHELFDVKKNSSEIRLFINPVHEKILQSLSEPVISESVIKKEGYLIFESLRNNSENRSEIVSANKLKICSLDIMHWQVSILKMCGFLKKVTISDLAYTLLDESFFNKILNDFEIIKQLSSSFSFSTLKQIYKSESSLNLFRKKTNMFESIDNNLLLLFLQSNDLFNEHHLLFLANLSSIKIDPLSIREKFKFFGILDNKKILDFLYKNVNLFADPELNIFDLKGIPLSFINEIERLDSAQKKIVLLNKNFKALLFNLDILKIINLPILCERDYFLNILDACRLLNFNIMKEWNEADVNKIFSLTNALTNEAESCLMLTPKIFAYVRSINEFEILCSSSLFSKIITCKNMKLLAKLGFSQLLKSQDYSVNEQFVVNIGWAGICSKSNLLSDLILGCGNDNLWKTIFENSSYSLSNVVDLINNDPSIRLQLSQNSPSEIKKRDRSNFISDLTADTLKQAKISEDAGSKMEIEMSHSNK